MRRRSRLALASILLISALLLFSCIPNTENLLSPTPTAVIAQSPTEKPTEIPITMPPETKIASLASTPTPTPTPTPTRSPTPTPTQIVPLADLYPVFQPGLNYEEMALYVGERIFFDTGVGNGGDDDSGAFNVKWYVNGTEMGYGGHEHIWARQIHYDGNSGFYWTPTAPGKYRLEFQVDCDNHVDESNENNNTLSFVVTILEPWGETPVQLGTCVEDKFDIYKYKAEVDLNGDGTLDKIEYHAGQTLTINGGQYQSTHVNFAQCFAIIDLYPDDGHLEILLTSAYRNLPDNWWNDPSFDVPGSFVCWWDGSIIIGNPMPGVMFDGAWRDTFDPYFHFGQGSVVKFLFLWDGTHYGWRDFNYDSTNHIFQVYPDDWRVD